MRDGPDAAGAVVVVDQVFVHTHGRSIRRGFWFGVTSDNGRVRKGSTNERFEGARSSVWGRRAGRLTSPAVSATYHTYLRSVASADPAGVLRRLGRRPALTAGGAVVMSRLTRELAFSLSLVWTPAYTDAVARAGASAKS